ncbi:DUF4127 family protein [Oscillibacter sp.]|jgi:hypothetical protein|uniref:DUF4127 family protein n=1 Tax=Oscillibacter sp. TaxID=1945593 RepID=UPI002170F82B|nr:DUF4127 family protein [Oscillibacter sp.]MCI9240845.1 DUF4127 family protein [Oscillibacter sp.]
MKRVKRLWAAVLALVLLAGCAPGRTEPLPYPEPAASEPGKTIAYVPLDDRPDNVERVVYLAESLGYALAMPEKVLYRTALDGQPKNFDSLQRGEPWSLFTWVLEQEAAGCDRYILSLDQLHSGGLVASRSMTGYDIELPGGGTVQVHSMLEQLLTALSADENNVVWLLDSVMRLAPTVGYEGGTLEDYNAIRAFGALPRRTLEGDALNLEDIGESYWWGPNGENLRSQTKEAGAYEAALRHVRSRDRKMTLSYVVRDTLGKPGYENFRLLTGIDDSSLEDCIQKNEIAYLRQGLRTDSEGKQLDWILSGVDDLAFKAVTRLYLDETGWTGAQAAVTYLGGTEDRPACEYDFQPLTEIMEEHLAFFDLREADTAELQILVLTQPEDPDQMNAYRKHLIEALRDYRKAQRPAILIDASNGTYGTAIYEALTKDTELGYLTAYSGMLDMAIVTGTALSHGVARYAVLKNGGGTDACDRAWARTLADSILKDFCYKGVVRNELLGYIRNGLGGDPNNFWAPDLDREDLLQRLEEGMKKETSAAIKNLERSRLITSLEPYAEKNWGGIALENYRFPWDRAFEIGMDIRLGEFQ